MMLHHVELYAPDLERSIAFWTPSKHLLGYAEERRSEGVKDIAGEQDPYVCLVQAPAEHLTAGYHRRRVGLNHLAFRARSRAHVDEVRAWVACRTRGYMMPDFDEVFARLRAILDPYSGTLERTVDCGGELSLSTTHVMPNGSPLWFGGVQVRKRYVSFHLMPVYVNPALLEGVSPSLRKRMQGKSCFNFTKVDPALFEELAALTRAGFEDYRSKGYVERRSES
jgi:catechol 2,3-dioxygenase-like lactoylglutathione lyase family enzyme